MLLVLPVVESVCYGGLEKHVLSYFVSFLLHLQSCAIPCTGSSDGGNGASQNDTAYFCRAGVRHDEMLNED